MVTTRVSEDVLRRLDQLTTGPFKPKRSAVVREAIEQGLPVLEAQAHPASLSNIEDYLGRAIPELFHASKKGGSSVILVELDTMLERALLTPLPPLVKEASEDVRSKMPKASAHWRDLSKLSDSKMEDLVEAIVGAIAVFARLEFY